MYLLSSACAPPPLRRFTSTHLPMSPASAFSVTSFDCSCSTAGSQRWRSSIQFSLLFSHCYARHSLITPGLALPHTSCRGEGLSELHHRSKKPVRFVACLSQPTDTRTSEGGDEARSGGVGDAIEEAVPTKDLVTIAACVVGLLTGIGVVLFNDSVHILRDLFWDGIPSRGASWLREEPIDQVWQRVVLIPMSGGVLVGILKQLRNSLDSNASSSSSNIKGALRPFLKAIAAAVTLGTGNSLGPEGPSVEIGSSLASGVGRVFQWSGGKKLSLIAAGSAAGIASGFNAAVSGCFFAVESVLWPSPADPFVSLTNSTPMVILSSVIASVISEVGLGSAPAFTVPEYDFRSPGELPLYLLLGVLCGLVSVILSRCTTFALETAEEFYQTTKVSKAIYPALGGLAVGLIALGYPEILYWGFENVDILLESRPFVPGLPADILFQLVGVKIVATSLSRASGLVGGYYAPSLFIGAATGMAYGKFVKSTLSGPNPLFRLSFFEVASPQAYGLVGMAATLAGVCQVPLTSVLLLFELTHDYRIVVPLLGAVGVSSWICSSQINRKIAGKKSGAMKEEAADSQQAQGSNHGSQAPKAAAQEYYGTDLCELESSLCLDASAGDVVALVEKVPVSQAMKTRYITVQMNSSVMEAVSLMLHEKQSCVVIIDDDGFLIGVLPLEGIENLSRVAKQRGLRTEIDGILVSHVCNLQGKMKMKIVQTWTATPDMPLATAQRIMDSHGLNHLPVVSELIDGQHRGRLVGLLDRECISIVCRAVSTKESLGSSSKIAVESWSDENETT